jgi:chromosome segregation ATPase
MAVAMRPLFLLILLLSTASCSKVYYAGLEKIGVPKRDLLQRRIEAARESQGETKEQFRSALDRFRATVRVEGGELEQRYDELRAELERSEDRAHQLEQRIDKVEDVAEALFSEWESELADYKRAELRAERRLAATRRAYRPMISAMHRAYQRVEPVLDGFRDVVLALKHQLNARAVASVQGELATIERGVDALVHALNASTEEASKFLTSLDGEPESR